MKKIILTGLVTLASLSAFADREGHAELSRHHGYQPVCATLINTEDPYRRTELKVLSSERIADLEKVTLFSNYGTVENWDNKISVVEIKKGCTLTAYQYKNFNVNLYSGKPMGGFVLVYNNALSSFTQEFELYGKANNRISSLSCSCQ